MPWNILQQWCIEPAHYHFERPLDEELYIYQGRGSMCESSSCYHLAKYAFAELQDEEKYVNYCSITCNMHISWALIHTGLTKPRMNSSSSKASARHVQSLLAYLSLLSLLTFLSIITTFIYLQFIGGPSGNLAYFSAYMGFLISCYWHVLVCLNNLILYASS